MDKYFQLFDDESINNRWYLDETLSTSGKISVWDITSGIAVPEKSQIEFSIEKAGVQLDFTLTAFDVPVVEKKVAAIFRAVNPENIQLLPALIDGKGGNYSVLNVIKLVKCVDETKSIFDRYIEEDDRPDKLGQYKTMIELRLDKTKINPADHCFRVANWEVALIVSEYLKDRLEKLGAVGPKFLEV